MASSSPSSNSVNRAARRSIARRGGVLGAGGVLVAGTAAALLTAFAGQAGAAATITVDSSGDGTATASNCTDSMPGNCTLRDAAAAAANGDTINFDAAISSITLTNGSIVLGTPNITGPGSALLTITTTAAAGSYDLFNFQGSGDVTVSGLSITKQRIFTANQGKFTLNDVSISGSYNSYGGALYAANSSDLVISGSHFENNTAAVKGGAIYAVSNGTVTVSNTTIENSASFGGGGGGIHVGANATSFTLTDSTVTGNTASYGAGLSISANGTVTIADSDISLNTATSRGGGAYVILGSNDLATQVTVERTTFDGNIAEDSGGGLHVADRYLSVGNSTFSNNQARLGGGISSSYGGEATINNTTISGNQAAQGGGFYSVGTDVAMNQSTISENSGINALYNNGDGGGVSVANGALNISGTILSGNTAETAGQEDVLMYGKGVFYSDHSIVGNVYGITVTDSGGTIFSTTPGLLALADNGGPTQTMSLDPTSAAIDAGPNPVATFTGNGFDQRGTPFVRIFNGTVDIGAFEVQDTPTPTSSTTSSSTTSTLAPTSSTTTSTLAPTSSTTTSTLAPTSSTTTSTMGIDPTTSTAAEDDPVAPTFTG